MITKFILLFGGSFNPPHLGHQLVISQAFELIPNIDELWLMPDYQHAFAKNDQLVSPPHRLAMTRMLENRKVKTASFTIDQKMSGNTIDHLGYLQVHYPDHHFSFLMGSDNLQNFHKWPHYQDLLNRMPFYIYPRAGFPFKPLYQNMHPLESPTQVITNLSSTIVRTRLSQSLNVKPLLPPQVLAYIKKHHLYFIR